MRDCTHSVTDYRLSVTMYTKYILQTTDSSRYFIYNLIKAGLMFSFKCNQYIPSVKLDFFLDPLNITNIVYVKDASTMNMFRVSNINRTLDNVIHRMIQFSILRV